MLELGKIEHTIGYEFKNEDLLQQAFVRKSYSEEHGGQNNEVLEFIGDKALDLAVIRIMMERFGVITEERDYSEFKLRNPKYFQTKYGEGKFTDIKQDLVKKKALSKAMDALGFHNYLIMGQGDIKQNRQNDASVKEDLFEAIIGAVAIDSDWDMDVLTEVIENMVDFDAYFDNDIENSQNYVGLVQEWYQVQLGVLPKYQYLGCTEKTIGESTNKSLENGKGLYKCQLYFDFKYFNGYGNNNSEAREKCAEIFYDWLEENGYIVDPIVEAIGAPNENEPIRQLNELYQKRLISKPIYTFQQGQDENGYIEWRCDCLVPENERTFTNYASSKKEAQKMSAYDALLDLID
ncbi:MAG: hypothetical protein K2I75_02005 [Clostridiales bacterium]|nr:hypothetical protein [Clostridiales bacterium]